jgi:hypothetical protein
MLPFRDKFNNDDPLANLEELLSLHTSDATVLLVLSNLLGLLTFWYANKIGLYFLAYSILFSVIVSCFYHLCQTSHECFQFTLADHVFLDHFTSHSMMGLFFLALFNVRTLCQILHKARVIKKYTCPPPCIKPLPHCPHSDLITLLVNEPPSPLIIPFESNVVDLCECGVAMDKHFTYNKVEENMIYDSWSAGSAIAILTITVVAVRAHPFSYAAFVIIFTCVVLAAYIKIALIEEGEPQNFIGRLSLPELIIGLILSFIGLTAYVLDSYFDYKDLHSIWHAAIYPAIMFLLAGTMRSVNGWFPLWVPCIYYIRDIYHGDLYE